MAFYGNPVGGFCYPKTYILTDENGTEMATGVVVGEKTVFDATPADVKVGKIFASDEGIQEGVDTKTNHTTIGSRVILPNESFSVPLIECDRYNYTKFYAMIADFNTTASDSTSVNKISINDMLYNVNSTSKLSDITKDSSTKSVKFNIINTTNNTYVIHYSTYKEE